MRARVRTPASVAPEDVAALVARMKRALPGGRTRVVAEWVGDECCVTASVVRYQSAAAFAASVRVRVKAGTPGDALDSAALYFPAVASS